MIEQLPPEIVFNIIAHISYKDVSCLRLVSRRLRTYCDQPIIWRSIILKPSEMHNDTRNILWKLIELKNIIDPHVSLIESVRIWGVRDNIVQYLLLSCPNLQHLTICGWTTLSDHCLRLLPSQSLKIKTLELIGTSQETNYVSVDAYTLSNLLVQSPHITSLIIGCDSQIHAETFVTELERHNHPVDSLNPDLRMLTLASRRSWLNRHILRLVHIYPDIQKIYLMPKLTEGFDVNQDDIGSWIARKLKEKIDVVQLAVEEIDRIPIYSTDNLLIYNKPATLYAN